MPKAISPGKYKVSRKVLVDLKHRSYSRKLEVSTLWANVYTLRTGKPAFLLGDSTIKDHFQ